MLKRVAGMVGVLISLWTGNAEAQYSDAVVKIGVLSDLSGPYSAATGAGSVAAARLAVEDFVSSRKPGFRIEVVAADHQNKPDIGSNLARAWFDTGQVDAIVDVPTSSVALAVSQLTRQKNKVFISSGAGTSDLTGSACSPNTVQWTYDTWSVSHGTAGALVREGGNTWYFLTADYAFGHAMERDASTAIAKNGGKVLGRVRTPFPSFDFSSFLLQAQSSKSKIVGLINAGDDTINSVKQAAEFGLVRGGQNLAAMLIFITDVHALSLASAQGLLFTESFYWDRNEGTRAFARRFAETQKGAMPTSIQAGVYAGVLHYLKAVEASGSDTDGGAVVEKMKVLPTDDPLFGKGSIRKDGRKIHDMFLFEVKKPSESSAPWDYYKLRATIPADEAWRPLKDGGCPLAAE